MEDEAGCALEHLQERERKLVVIRQSHARCPRPDHNGHYESPFLDGEDRTISYLPGTAYDRGARGDELKSPSGPTGRAVDSARASEGDLQTGDRARGLRTA